MLHILCILCYIFYDLNFFTLSRNVCTFTHTYTHAHTHIHSRTPLVENRKSGSPQPGWFSHIRILLIFQLLLFTFQPASCSFPSVVYVWLPLSEWAMTVLLP